MAYLSEEFTPWLEKNAATIDQESGGPADELLEKIAAEGVFGLGVDEALGGQGGDAKDVIGFLSELAGYSLTASFISWGQRTFIENILSSSNPYARETWLEDLLTGKLTAGTALSNATKFLSDIEDLNVTVIEEDGQYYLKGRLPWVTNLRSDNFIAVFATKFEDDRKKPLIVTVPSTAQNLSRSEDLEFIALQGSNTAALTFDKVPLDERWILSDDAQAFLAETRPEFLGYQFGLAFGLAERSLSEVEKTLSRNRSILTTSYQETLDSLNSIKERVFDGLENRKQFLDNPLALFQLRIDIVDVVAASLLLELQASGGRGYFKHSTSSFSRRWNEGAFLPVVSPSAFQLRLILEEEAV